MQVLDTTRLKEGVGLDPVGGAYALIDKPAHPNAATEGQNRRYQTIHAE